VLRKKLAVVCFVSINLIVGTQVSEKQRVMVDLRFGVLLSYHFAVASRHCLCSPSSSL
jgi:hypothetical protein